MQTIRFMLRDVSKKVASFRRTDPAKLCGWAKNCHQCKNFQTFLDVGEFLAQFKGFKVGVAHPRCEIGSLSGSPSFGTLIKCVGGLV